MLTGVVGSFMAGFLGAIVDEELPPTSDTNLVIRTALNAFLLSMLSEYESTGLGGWWLMQGQGQYAQRVSSILRMR